MSFFTENYTTENIKKNINICYNVHKEYRWILDAYVLDFYTQKFWNRLLPSWKLFVDDLQPNEIANLMNHNEPIKFSSVLPLSLVCIRKILQSVCLSRTQKLCDKPERNVDFNPKLFWKNVKLKKRHEIKRFAEICYDCATKINCDYIVDVGAGLGHLSRTLAYVYGLKVLSLEYQENLSKQAVNLDLKLRNTKSTNIKSNIVYVVKRIETHTTAEDLEELLKEHFKIDGRFTFGIVGLHACGDLSATLLRMYKNGTNVKFIAVASCCYMKLSTPASSLHHGYPLSEFCANKSDINYNSREVACHAIETYIDRLYLGLHWELKIHAYRAVIEVLIVQSWPHLHHSSLSNVKYKETLSFKEYCERALKKLNVALDESFINSMETEENLSHWRRVVKFYSLKLMLAPVVETLILLDRMLFATEISSKCIITAAFDPKMSPRNQVLVAIK